MTGIVKTKEQESCQFSEKRCWNIPTRIIRMKTQDDEQDFKLCSLHVDNLRAHAEFLILSDIPITLSPIVNSLYDWLQSDEGKSCLDTRILNDPSLKKYLKNRLMCAFHAGVKAQKETEGK